MDRGGRVRWRIVIRFRWCLISRIESEVGVVCEAAGDGAVLERGCEGGAGSACAGEGNWVGC